MSLFPMTTIVSIPITIPSVRSFATSCALPIENSVTIFFGDSFFVMSSSYLLEMMVNSKPICFARSLLLGELDARMIFCVTMIN